MCEWRSAALLQAQCGEHGDFSARAVANGQGHRKGDYQQRNPINVARVIAVVVGLPAGTAWLYSHSVMDQDSKPRLIRSDKIEVHQHAEQQCKDASCQAAATVD